MNAYRSLAVMAVLGLSTAWATPAWAQTSFKILDRTVLTIREPEGQTTERVQQIDERLLEIVDAAEDEQLDVAVTGDEELAEIRVNGTVLVEVTQDDAAANETDRAIALAEVWGERLTAALEEPEVREELFRSANMPDQLTIAGQQYVMSEEPIIDRGTFVTDGSRVDDRVIFWEEQQDLESPELPNPMPEQVYVLNRFREFILYRAI